MDQNLITKFTAELWRLSERASKRTGQIECTRENEVEGWKCLENICSQQSGNKHIQSSAVFPSIDFHAFPSYTKSSVSLEAQLSNCSRLFVFHLCRSSVLKLFLENFSLCWRKSRGSENRTHMFFWDERKLKDFWATTNHFYFNLMLTT